MPLVRERGDNYICDVVRIDERFEHGARRQGNLAGQHAVDQIALGEVLIEPARVDIGPDDAGRLQRRFRALRTGFVAAGQQHDVFQPFLGGPAAQLGDGVRSAFDRADR